MAALASLSVLVIDDNAAMRAIVIAMLNAAGVRQVHSAGGVTAAMALLRQETIDLAIVDYKMTPLDGAAFIRMVRTDADSPDVYLPIIMMTGHADLRRIKGARDAGVTEFMVKPITAKALLGRIETIILRPRPFVRLDGYFGPDRRRADRAAPQRRRASDAG